MADNELQNYVNHKIKSGQFSSAEEFAAEAIRVYRRIEQDYNEYRLDIQESIALAEAGDLAPLDVESIKNQLTQEFNEDGSRK